MGLLKAALGRQQTQHGYEQLHIPDVAAASGAASLGAGGWRWIGGWPQLAPSPLFQGANGSGSARGA